MVNIGIAGIGFMGMIHYLSYEKVRGAKVTAICDVDPKRVAGDWRGIQGNFGPAGKRMDLSEVAGRYSDFEQLIADPGIELVDLCLPPAMHADAAVAALQAGKHVFCEKPMALTAQETKRMVSAAEQTGKLLLIGHVLPLFPEYDYAYHAATSGRYGDLLGGHFRRVINDPAWLANYWDAEKIGGPMLDLNIHDTHYIRLLFGMPTSVSSRGRMRGDVVEYFTTQFDFEEGANQEARYVVTLTGGVTNQPGRSFNHGFEIQFERATMLFEFAVIDGEPHVMMPLTVLTDKGRVLQPKLGSGDPVDAFEIEMKEVVRCVRAGKTNPVLAAELAQDAIKLCQRQTASVRKSRRVKL